MVSQVSVFGIDIYQKYLSPHKGYSCAYKYYIGKDSCSEFTKKSIIKFGLLKSIPYFFKHLKKCKHVYEINTVNDSNPNSMKKDKEVDKCNEACGVLPCL